MRILHVTDDFLPHTDGLVISLINIAKRMHERGHDVGIIAPDYNERIPSFPFQVFLFPSLPFPSYPDFRIATPSLRSLKHAIDEFAPDIIHLHTIPGVLSTASMLLARLEKITLISTYHASYPDALPYLGPAKMLRLDKLVDFQTIEKYLETIKHRLPRLKEPLPNKAVWAFTNRFFNRCDHIIAPSEAVYNELKKHNVKPPVTIISNGIIPSKFPRKKTYHKIPKFLHLGRLGYEKKIEVLIKAMHKVVDTYPRAHMTIVGKGPAKKSLQSLVKKYRLQKKITFKPFVPHDEVDKVYRKHDVFVTASEIETQGLVLLEAMLSGLPVIGVDVLAIPDLVRHNETGLLADRRDHEKIAEHMMRLIEHPDEVKRLGVNARQLAQSHDVKKSVDDLIGLYEDTIEEPEVCMYFEAESLLDKKPSGILTAYQNFLKMMDMQGIPYTTNPKKPHRILHLHTAGPKAYYHAKTDPGKVVISTHSTGEDFKESFTMSDTLSPILTKYLKRFYSKADLLICPSSYTADLLRSQGIDIRIEVISNGINLEGFRHSQKKRDAFRKQYGLTKTAVFSVGHVFKRKGIEEFIDVARMMPKYQFYWTGAFYNKLLVYGKDIRKAIEEAPKNFQMTGFVDDILAAYSAGDIFMFPSHEENQGVVILEAAAMGKPIVVRDIPVYRDWLFHGKNCLKAKDNEEFMECIRWIDQDDLLRKKLIKGAKKLAGKNSLQNVAKKLKEVYLSIDEDGKGSEK